MQSGAEQGGQVRIGELSRRVGVSVELLRAWERRYGLLQPTRSAGGFRLYSDADERRLRAMARSLERGLSAAEAARAALVEGEDDRAASSGVSALEARLHDALLSYDEAEAHAALDRLLAMLGTGTVLAEIVLPVVRAIGDGWSEGRVSIAQEHFVSNLLRGRLLGLARGWGQGAGPIAVLACPPGEQHDLPLIIFGIALRQEGWRIAFLGADTPIATIEDAVASVHPRAVVLSAVVPQRLHLVESELAALARVTTVALGGDGAEPALAERAGALLLQGDPVVAAADFARGAGSRPA